ncbi:MAG: hypothetical protein ACJAZO_000151 [Myxococcota bacterium]
MLDSFFGIVGVEILFGMIVGVIRFVVLLDKDISAELKGSQDVEPQGSSV